MASVLANLWWTFHPGCTLDCTPVDTYTPIVLMGLAYGLAAGSSWNSLIYLVKGKRIGTVLGVGSGFLNIGIMVIPILMGYLIDQAGGQYHTICLLSLGLAVASLVIAGVIYLMDRHSNKILGMNVAERNKFYEEVN